MLYIDFNQQREPSCTLKKKVKLNDIKVFKADTQGTCCRYRHTYKYTGVVKLMVCVSI
jgi:hypothetical protein